MNAFMFAGDMTHLLSILLLLHKIRTTKSCAGISLKTQELYVIVFITRYIDLFITYRSFYNSLMKIVFLGASIGIVWYMRYHKVVKQTYNKEEDTFRHLFLIVPCFVLSLLINPEFTVVEIGAAIDNLTPPISVLRLDGKDVVLWAFSIYLEAVVILPQLVLLQRSSNIDNLTGNYVFLLGAYRAIYLLNWIYRFFTENHQVRWIPWLSGLVQTAIYTDFFYYYIKSWKNRENLKLPA